MKVISIWSLSSRLGLVVMLGCGLDDGQLILDQHSTDLGSGIDRQEFISAEGLFGLDKFAWSEPVWLGPVINSPELENGASLSHDGLSLYFNSGRSGLGGLDIWVSRRARPGCPWETPVNLGLPVNTDVSEGVPVFSTGGHLMFFTSHGHDGGQDDADIYVSQRADPNSAFGWEAPVKLGAEVNTPAHESSPAYLQSGGSGGQLYFTRDGEFYVVPVDQDGRARGASILIPELSNPGGVNRALTVRADGRELIFFSSAPHPDGHGRADLWVANRRSVNDVWSAPRNLGPPLNSEIAELEARLSHDGRTLLISMGAARGGSGGSDLWISTRGPSAKEEGANSTQCP